MKKQKPSTLLNTKDLTSPDITKLRSMFFKEKIDFKVAKNTLIKIALKNSKINELDKLLSGSTAVAISYEEPVSPAKVIKDFNKVSDLPRVKGILFEGQFFEGEQYKKFADLPSKDELIAKLAMMLGSPMVKFATTINAPMQNLANLLHSLKQSKS